MQKQHGKVLTSQFNAPRWAKNRHIQTIWPRYFKRTKRVKLKWQQFDLPDRDFVDLAWGPKPENVKGMVVMFHGLEGSIRSHYAMDMMSHLYSKGYHCVMMHFRGCSGKQNNTVRAYHSGDTGDALLVIEHVKKICGEFPLFALGVSLGGNMLLKLCAENKDSHGLKAIISISAPLKLDECSDSINRGFSRLYQHYLLRSMKNTLISKMKRLDYAGSLDLNKLDVPSLRNFRQFDDKITAPLHGFAGADDYYKRCSSFHFLRDIQCPTLILHAADDPFMNESVIPKDTDLAPNVTVELSQHGGHVGFMQGKPWRPKIWLHKRVADFFDDHFTKDVNT